MYTQHRKRVSYRTHGYVVNPCRQMKVKQPWCPHTLTDDGHLFVVSPPVFQYVCMLSCFSCVQLFVTPQTVAHQAPFSREFSRQEYWGRLPFPTTGHFPDPRMEPTSLKSPSLAGGFFTTSITWEVQFFSIAF